MGEDPDSIQRQIRATRRELAVTAEALATRASPRLQARRFARRRAADIARLTREMTARLRGVAAIPPGAAAAERPRW